MKKSLSKSKKGKLKTITQEWRNEDLRLLFSALVADLRVNKGKQVKLVPTTGIRNALQRFAQKQWDVHQKFGALKSLTDYLKIFFLVIKETIQSYPNLTSVAIKEKVMAYVFSGENLKYNGYIRATLIHVAKVKGIRIEEFCASIPSKVFSKDFIDTHQGPIGAAQELLHIWGFKSRETQRKLLKQEEFDKHADAHEAIKYILTNVYPYPPSTVDQVIGLLKANNNSMVTNLIEQNQKL